jgi:transposase-like protein
MNIEQEIQNILDRNFTRGDNANALKELLVLYNVVGQSEQLTCPRCKSTNILSPDKDNDPQCIECAFIWAG